jgi:hypothetical protein
LQQQNFSLFTSQNVVFVLCYALKRKDPLNDSYGELHNHSVIHVDVEKKECDDNAPFLVLFIVFFEEKEKKFLCRAVTE